MHSGLLDNLNLLFGAVAASTIHTILPNHWLPFTLIARDKKWGLGKTQITVTIAGLIHILSSIVLGIVVAVIGKQFLANVDMETAGPIILFAFGLIYIFLHIARRHYHHHHELSENVAVWGLILGLILSPCEELSLAFIPIAYISGGWWLVLLMSTILAMGTVLAMLIVVTLSFLGLQKLQFNFLDKYEKLIIGVIFCLIGVRIFRLASILGNLGK